MWRKIKKNYVSEIDTFLARFDTAHEQRSASQQAEISKHARIAELRDQAKPSPSQTSKISTLHSDSVSNKAIWEEF